MGILITQAIKKNRSNPFAGMVSRGEDGSAVFDLAGAASAIRGTNSAAHRDTVGAMLADLGDRPTVDAVRAYSRDVDGGGYSGSGESTTYAQPNTFSPFSNDIGRQALDSALEAFEIREKGQADAARISQQGREKAAIANMGSGIASAQRRALGAAEQNAYDQQAQEGGVADVVEGSNVEEAGGEEGGNDTARRKRQSFGGAGLAMRI